VTKINGRLGKKHSFMMTKLNYENSLAALGLTTLEARRLREDLIDIFKIFKGQNHIIIFSRIG